MQVDVAKHLPRFRSELPACQDRLVPVRTQHGDALRAAQAIRAALEVPGDRRFDSRAGLDVVLFSQRQDVRTGLIAEPLEEIDQPVPERFASLCGALAGRLGLPLGGPARLDLRRPLNLGSMRAQRRGLQLEDAAIDWLLKRVDRDLVSLTALLDRLDRESLAAQRRLTVPFLRSVLGG